MITASIFQNGSSQAIRIPKQFRFQDNKVEIKKIGKYIVLVPIAGSWDSLLNSLDKFSDDFMAERSQPDLQIREGLFE